MLGSEDRMTAPWGLLAVIGGIWRGEPFFNEVAGMGNDHLETIGIEVGAILGSEPEARSERRLGEPRKDCVQVTHRANSIKKEPEDFSPGPLFDFPEAYRRLPMKRRIKRNMLMKSR